MKSGAADYWPDEGDFETEEECGEFFNALAVLEDLGRVDELVRFLQRGTPISRGVAKTLAYVLGGGKLQSSSPKRERIVITVPSDTPRDFFPDQVLTPDGIKFILPRGAQLQTIPPKTLRGPFYVTVEERLPSNRPADPTKDDRYWSAAEEVRKRVEGGEQLTKALKAVRAEYKLNINRLISSYHMLDM